MGCWGPAAHGRAHRPVRTGVLRLRGIVGESDRPAGDLRLPSRLGRRSRFPWVLPAGTDDPASEVGGPLSARSGRYPLNPDRPREPRRTVRTPILGPPPPRAGVGRPPLDPRSCFTSAIPRANGEPDLLCRRHAPPRGAARATLPAVGWRVSGVPVPVCRRYGPLADRSDGWCPGRDPVHGPPTTGPPDHRWGLPGNRDLRSGWVQLPAPGRSPIRPVVDRAFVGARTVNRGAPTPCGAGSDAG